MTTPQSTPSVTTIAKTWDAKHIALVIIATAAAVFAWTTYREEIHDRSQMQATISAEEQQLKQDQSDLSARLAAIEKDKAAPKTAAQIIEKIPQYIPLPEPLQIQSQPLHSATTSNTAPATPLPAQNIAVTELPDQPKSRSQTQRSQAKNAPVAVLPEADLKALYAFGANCQECQLKLANSQKQIQELTVERDAAVKSVKGGSFWTRLKRNLHWFAVGAGVGAATLCATGHCK